MAHPQLARILSLSVLIMIMTAACNQEQGASQTALSDLSAGSSEKPVLKNDPILARKLMKGEWRLVAIDQRELVHGGTPTVVFGDEGKCWGSTGVNNFHTTFSLLGPDEDRVKVGPAAVTRKAGPPEAMAVENLFLERFESANSFKVIGDKLHLNSGDAGNLTFQRISP